MSDTPAPTPDPTPAGKRPTILIGIAGGIATYKVGYIIKHLRDHADLEVVMTANAARFVTPLTFASLIARPVITDLFADSEAGKPTHITLADTIDAVLLAPATANLLGKLAHGIADDTLTTLLLSIDVPVVIAPAMNVRMWGHPLVQDNVARLKRFGYHFVEPESGFQACRHVGPGRLAEEAVIATVALSAARGALAPPRSLD